MGLNNIGVFMQNGKKYIIEVSDLSDTKIEENSEGYFCIVTDATVDDIIQIQQYGGNLTKVDDSRHKVVFETFENFSVYLEKRYGDAAIETIEKYFSSIDPNNIIMN